MIYAADIGSIKKDRFGWARKETSSIEVATGKCINAFADSIITDMKLGYKIALGFECPLFVPLTENPIELTSSRHGEGSRPWSAGAGSGALATGLTETLWVFSYLKNKLSIKIQPTYKFDDIENDRANLFIWEAFVSGKSKGVSHHDDAVIAVKEFYNRLDHKNIKSDVTAVNPYSLVGAALLRSGISDDISLLYEQCLVIKA